MTSRWDMSLLALLSGRGREVVVSLVGSRLRVPPDGVQSDVTTGAATTHFEGVWQYALLYSCLLFCTDSRMTFVALRLSASLGLVVVNLLRQGLSRPATPHMWGSKPVCLRAAMPTKKVSCFSGGMGTL